MRLIRLYISFFLLATLATFSQVVKMDVPTIVDADYYFGSYITNLSVMDFNKDMVKIAEAKVLEALVKYNDAPSTDLAVFLKANIDLQNGNYLIALKELDAFRKERKNSPFIASTYLFSGYINLEIGDYISAQNDFRDAANSAKIDTKLRKDKEHYKDISYSATYWLAISLCQQGKYIEAIPFFEAVYMNDSLLTLQKQIESNDSAVIFVQGKYSAQSIYALGSIAENDKNYEKAIKYFNIIQNNYKYSNVIIPSLIRQANDELLLRNPQSAFIILQKAESAEQHILAKDSIGTLYAVQDFNENYFQNVLYLKGEAFNQIANYEQAILCFEELIKYLKQNNNNLNSINLTQTQSKFNSKNTTIEKLINNNSLLNYANMGLGWAYLYVPDYNKAIFYYQQAIDNQIGEFDDGFTMSNIKALAYLNKITALRKLGRIEEAQSELSFLSVQPNFPQLAFVQLELGQIYYEKGDYDLARRTLERAEREADNPKIQIRISALLGETYLELKQYGNAVNSFRKTELLAINVNPILVPNKLWYLNESLLKQGIALVLVQRSGEAIQPLLKYISEVPSQPNAQISNSSDTYFNKIDEAMFWLAEAYYRSDMLRNSTETYNKLITNYPKSKKREDALYGLGWSYFRLENFDQSSATFDKMVKEFPISQYATEVLARQADGYYRNRNFAKASDYYSRAAKQGPNTEEGQYASYQLAHTLYRQNKYEQSVTAALNFVKQYPKTSIAPNALYLIAWIRFQQEKYSESIENFQFLISTYPQSRLTARAYFAIADCYYNMGNYEQSIDGYKVVVEQFPSSELIPEAMKSIQQALVALDRDSEAIGIADSYINNNPSSPFIEDFKYKKAEMYYTGKRYPDAISEYESFVNNYPESEKSAEALYWMGKSYAAMDDFNNASASFLKLKKLFPQNDYASSGLLEYGLLLKQQNMIDSANAIFEIIQKEYPKNDAAPQAGFERAILFFGKGDTLNAITQFREVADNYPETDYGDQSRYRVAMYFRFIANYNAAINEFGKIADVFDNPTISAEARYRIGELYLKIENLDSAKISFEIIKEKFSGYEDWFSLGMLSLGEIYEKEGNIDDAKEIYITIQQFRPSDEFGKTATQRLKRMK